MIMVLWYMELIYCDPLASFLISVHISFFFFCAVLGDNKYLQSYPW